MTPEQSMTLATAQTATEVDKAAIMTVKEVENPVNAGISVEVMPRTGSTALKHQTFDWKSGDKCKELQHLEIEAKNIFMTYSYNIQHNKKVPVTLSLVGREGLQYMQH